MTVYFINKTENTVIVELGNNKIKINNGKKIKVDSKTNRILFSCYTTENSTFKYLPLTKSVILEYNFILNSLYELTFESDFYEINLVQKQVKGSNLERYKFIDLQLSSGNINRKEFCVQDELSIKNQLFAAREREKKLEKKLRIVDVMQSICYIGIPALIIFIGTWYISDFKTALYILIPLTIIGVTVGLLLKKVIGKFINKLDEINAKYENETNKFSDINSFFDKSYIYSVLNNENAGNDSMR